MIRIVLLFMASLTAMGLVPAAAAATHGLEADPEFGHGGQALVEGLRPSALAVRPEGLLIVEPGAFGVAALTPAGQLDPAFGNAGRAAVELARSDARPRAAAVDAQGRIVVVGSASYAVPHTPATHDQGHVIAMAAARFLPNGTPDPEFGAGGVVLVGFADGASVARSALVLPDGGVVLAGSAQDGDVTAVALLDGAGRPDPRFGSHGRIVVDGGAGSEGARAVISAGDDRLVVAGVTSGFTAYAARLTRTGPDPSFGDGGVFAMRGVAGDTAAADAIAVPGRLLLPGRFHGRPGVLALDDRGRIDPTYGDGGIAEVTAPAGLRMAGTVRAAVDASGLLTQTWEVFDPVARRSHLLARRFDAAGRPQGEPASAGIASARTVNPIGVVDAGAGRSLVLCRTHGPGDLVGAALVRLRPATAHPAVKRRGCKRPRRHRSRQRRATKRSCT